nr:MAG TPA: hypothetical protein [Caudoviricetes sp.]
MLGPLSLPHHHLLFQIYINKKGELEKLQTFICN